MSLWRQISIRCGLLAVLVLSPVFFGAVHAWTYLTLSALIFILLVIRPEAIKEISNLPKMVTAPIALVLGFLFIQTFFFSIDSYSSSLRLLFWIASMVLFLIVQSHSRRHLYPYFYGLLAIAALITIYGFMELTGESEHVLWVAKETHLGYMTATFMNRNHYAGFLELCMGLLLGLWFKAFKEKDQLSIVALTGLVMLLGAGFLKSGSRMGLFSFVTAFMIVSALFKQKDQKGMLPFILFVLGAFLIGVWWQKDLILARFEHLNENLLTWDGRLTAWQATLEMMMASPIFGVGLGNFAWVFPEHQPASLLWRWQHAHNDYLELGVEIGLPALVMILFSFSALLVWAKKRMEYLKEEYYPLVWGLLVGVFSLCIHGLCDFNFAMPGNVLIFVFSLAAAIRFLRGRADEDSVMVEAPLSSIIYRFTPWVVRTGAVILILFSAQKAYADAILYRGAWSFKNKNYLEAMRHFKDVPQMDQNRPEYAFRLAHAMFRQGLTETTAARRVPWHRLAQSHFEVFTKMMPRYGLGWLYFGINKLYALELANENVINTLHWQAIVDALDKALKYEPHTRFMRYNVGIYLLSYREGLLVQIREKAIHLLRTGASRHESRFLEDALAFLWGKYNDPDLLIEITPEDYLSYRKLTQFLESVDAWQAFAKAHDVFLNLKEKAYYDLLKEGRVALSKWHMSKAFQAFDDAYWLYPKRPAARLGRLIVLAERSELPRNYREEIIEILQRPSAEYEFLLPYLKDVIGLVGDPHLEGLYAFRRGKLREAIALLSRVDEGRDVSRFILAGAYQALGDTKESVHLLLPALKEEDPDVRELILLETLDSVYQNKAVNKLKETVTKKRGFSEWRGEGFSEKGVMDHYGKNGMVINLMPGRVTVKFEAKAKPNKAGIGAMMIVRFGGNVVASYLVSHSEYQTYEITVDQEGGKHWFEVEFLNGAPSADAAEGPVLYLGALEVVT